MPAPNGSATLEGVTGTIVCCSGVPASDGSATLGGESSSAMAHKQIGYITPTL